MKRDMDLIRKILLYAEESESSDIPKVTIQGYTEEQINYHLKLLNDANLVTSVKVTPITESGFKMITPRRLTWEGHEFLDAARDDTTWQKAKKVVTEKGGSLTFEVIKGVLAQLARQTVGLP
jgi:repressor of nif and glnA expression